MADDDARTTSDAAPAAPVAHRIDQQPRYVFESWPVSAMTPHPQQARTRTITDESLGYLGASMQQLGVTDEISVNRRTGHVISGHQRLKILAADGHQNIRVKVYDVSPQLEDAMFWEANNPKAAGTYTPEAPEVLLELKDELGDAYADLGLGALEVSLSEDEAPHRDDYHTHPDHIPAQPLETDVKLGELYLLGNHRLVCGDATDARHVHLLLGLEIPFMLVTDPPYGIEYEPNWRADASEAGYLDRGGTRRSLPVPNDDRADWTPAWRLFAGDVAYVWHASLRAHEVRQSLQAAGFDIRAQIVWAKTHFPIGRGHYHWRHELLWYAVRQKATARWCGDRTQSTVWNIGLDESVPGAHSTQKPVECMIRPIQNHGQPGDGIYDPFVGTGTTIIACQMAGRRCFAMDINPQFVQICINRWEAFTGLKAERVAPVVVPAVDVAPVVEGECGRQ